MEYVKSLFIVGLFAILSYSCVEPFSIGSIDFDRAIVVEGRLTNEARSHYVKLSYTRRVDEDETIPLTGATVWVENGAGSRIDFAETAPGLYECRNDIAGMAGKSYRLHFNTKQGGSYRSTAQELISSPPIDSVYHAYAERASSNSTKMQKGIQFFVDTHDETGAAQYYKYEWEETYEVQAMYPSMYEFFANPDTVIRRSEEVSPCFASERSNKITLGTTANLTESRLSEMPVRYITSETDQLRYAYSILVRQYAISSEAYGFYREVLANNEGNGSLFDQQLGTVAGNITSVENSDETVLGFFEVSGASEKRAFTKFDELDPRYPWPSSPLPCAADRLLTVNDLIQPLPYKLEDSVRIAIEQGYGIVTVAYCDSIAMAGPPPVPPGCAFYAWVRLAPNYCTDCRIRGPVTKPEFWIY